VLQCTSERAAVRFGGDREIARTLLLLMSVLQCTLFRNGQEGASALQVVVSVL
jgi:hypothetical protein